MGENEKVGIISSTSEEVGKRSPQPLLVGRVSCAQRNQAALSTEGPPALMSPTLVDERPQGVSTPGHVHKEAPVVIVEL